MSSDDATPAEATPPAEDAADDPAPEEEEPEEPLPMECDATLVFAFRARAPPRPIAAPRASVVPAEETSDDHEKADASGGDAPAKTTTEPTPEAEAAAREDDPVTSSMTITWTLPDGATATTPHPLVLERRDAGVVDVDFVSASAMIRVDEAKLRAIAATPFVAVTFTRVDEARRTPEEAGEEAAGEAVDDAPAADAPGPTTTTYSVTLGVSGVILGVRAFERLTFTTSDARVRETVTDDDYALLPPILAGYADASFELRYAGDGTSPPEPEPAPEAEAEAEASDAAAPLPPPPPPTFIPSGLAREMAPFAVTLRSIDRLPDAPASAAALTEKCEPVTAHWRFASGVLPVVSLEATSSSGWSEPMAGTYPPIRTRGAEFGVPTMLFGMDMAGWSEGECDVYRTCATSVLEVRVHDRVKMEDKEATAAMAAFLGRGKGRKKKKKKKPEGEEGEEEAEEEEEEAAEGEDADGDKPPDDADAAADADARADEEAPAGDGFPAADVYGLATFDLRALCHPPHVARALSAESKVLPMTNVPRGGDLDWSSRPGRFADSDASVRLVFETATPLTPKRGASRSRPYVRAVFTVAYDNARLFRELLGIVRAQNAEALDIRGTPKHVLFALSTMKLTPAQVVDPGVRVMTGYHVIDGIRRQLLIEGSVDVMRPVFDVARREKARGGRSVILCNPALTHARRAYGSLGADLWPIKLCDDVARIAGGATCASGGVVGDATREAVRRISALARGGAAWARQVERARLCPTPEMLVALDRRFGDVLTIVDLTGRAPIERAFGWHRSAAEAAARARDGGSLGSEGEGGLRTALTFAEDTLATGAGADVHDDQGATFICDGSVDVDESGGSSGRRRAKTKPELDTTSPEGYLEELAARRRLRLRRDVDAEEMATIRALEKTVGTAKRAAWQTWNVTRITRERAAAILADVAARTAEMDAAARAKETAEMRALHPEPFKWPPSLDREKEGVHRRAPTEKRVEELKEPHVEGELLETNYVRDLRKTGYADVDGGKRPPFKPQSKAPPDFGTDKSHYATVHLVGEKLLAEQREAEEKEREAWKQKVVVDSTYFKTTLPGSGYGQNGPISGERARKPLMVDKYDSMLRDPPAKHSLKGKYVKGASAPPPVSMHTKGRYVAPDQGPKNWMETTAPGPLGGTLREPFGGGENLSTGFLTGNDFVRINVGDRTGVHRRREKGTREFE